VIVCLAGAVAFVIGLVHSFNMASIVNTIATVKTMLNAHRSMAHAFVHLVFAANTVKNRVRTVFTARIVSRRVFAKMMRHAIGSRQFVRV
jgi:hypothetical protein